MGSHKRKSESSSLKSKKLKPQVPVLNETGFINDYDGYNPIDDFEKIDIININDIKQENFYTEYVHKRKPVLIEGVIPDLDLAQFQPDSIVKTLDSDDLLLVEKRHKGGFGSGTDRIKMTFKELMEKLNGSEAEDYYLTTQYTEDDPDLTENGLSVSDDNDDDDDDNDNHDNLETKKIFDSYTLNPPAADDFSDSDSIDFDNVHDDFENLSNNSHEDDDDNDDEITDDSQLGHPLTKLEAETRVQELLQKPLTNLIKSNPSFPIQPKLLTKLIPQQINLWIGASDPQRKDNISLNYEEDDLGLGRNLIGKTGGVSSGLHHDHADNLYILIKGSKRFTLFSPNDTDKMNTVGDINQIYPSGIIDYKRNSNAPGWRHLRGDGAIITEVAKWKLENDDDLSSEERDVLISLIEDEENSLAEFEKSLISDTGEKRDPPSFSKIPASIVHISDIDNNETKEKLVEFAKQKYESFLKAKRITAYIKPGQLLYLPAGWFHEVTSFGDDSSSNIHMALNYWFSPPNKKDKDLYQDGYWEDDFKRTLKSLDYIKKQSFDK